MAIIKRIITSWTFLILLLLATIIVPLCYGLVQLGSVDTIPDQTVVIYLACYLGVNTLTFLLLCLKAIKGFSMRRFISGMLFILLSLLIFNEIYYESYGEFFFESYMGIVFSLFIALPQLVILLTRLIRLFVPDRKEKIIKPVKVRVFSFTLNVAFLFAGSYLGYLLFKDLFYLNEYDTVSGVLIFLLSLFFVSLVNFKLLIVSVSQVLRWLKQEYRRVTSIGEISLVFNFSKPVKPKSEQSKQALQPYRIPKSNIIPQKNVGDKKRFMQFTFKDIENYLLKRVGVPLPIKTHRQLWLTYAVSVYALPICIVIVNIFTYQVLKPLSDTFYLRRIELVLLTFLAIFIRAKMPLWTNKMIWFVSVLDQYDKQSDEQKNSTQVPKIFLNLYQISQQILISVFVIVLASALVLIIISSNEPNTAKIKPQTLSYYMFNISTWAVTGSFLYLIIVGSSVFIGSQLIYYYKALTFYKLQKGYEKAH